MGDWKITGTGAGGAVATPSPGNITLGTPKLSVVRISGVPNVRATISYTPPSTLNGFDRVHVYLQAPDDAVEAKAAISPGTPSAAKGFRVRATANPLDASISRVVPTQEALDMGVTVDNPEERIITVTYPLPAKKEYWRVYCAPGSKDVEPVLVKGAGAGATPSVRFEVDPAVLDQVSPGLEIGPTADTFTAINPFPRYGRQDGGDAWYGFDVQWTDKTSDPRFSELGGYIVYVEYPDGRREPTSGALPITRHTFTSDRWPQSDRAERFILWLVSWRKIDGQENNIVDGLTPKLVMDVMPQRGSAGQEYTDLTTVTGVQQNYLDNAQGQKSLRLLTQGTVPSVNNYGGFQVWLIRKYGTGQESHHALTGAGETRFPTESWVDAYPNTSEPAALYALSVDGNGRKNNYVAGVTPLYTFTLQAPTLGGAGQEYTGLSSVTDCIQNYVTDAQGQKTLRLTVNGTKAAEVTMGAVALYIIRDFGGSNVHRPLKGNQFGFPIEAFVPDFPQTNEAAALYVLSVDVNNKSNTYQAGVTPVFPFTLGAPTTGAVGTEYTPNVIPPGGSSLVTVTTLKADDGTKMVKVVTNYTNPTAPEYGGAAVVAHRPPYGTGDFVLIGEEREPGHAMYTKGPTAVETWRFYVRARDVNGRYNTIVPAASGGSVATPRQDLSVGSATGTFDPTKMDATKYNTSEFWVNTTTGIFEQKIISADKIQTGTLLVGGYVVGTQTPRPGKLGVTDSLGNIFMYAGFDPTYGYTFWGKSGGFGGSSFGDAKVKFLSDGSAIMDGATFRLHLNQTDVTIDNSFNSGLAGYVAFKVRQDAALSAYQPTCYLLANQLQFTQVSGGADVSLAQVNVAGVGPGVAGGLMKVSNYEGTRSITMLATQDRMVFQSEVGQLEINGVSQQILINNVNVLKARFGTRPVVLADVINLLVYHGLCA